MIFFLHGCIAGVWVPNVPLAKERLEVGTGIFGLALLCMALGAVVAMPLAGALINRFGSAPMTRVTGLWFGLMLLGPALAPDLLTFCIALLVFGAGMGSMDVSMNSHGIAVEKRLGRPVMSSLHGIFSLGATAGAGAGALLIKPLGALGFTAGIICLYALALLAAQRQLLEAEADRGLSGTSFGWPTRASIGLGLLCFLALMSEGAVLDWAAIHLRQTFALDASRAALGFGLFSAGMTVSRLSGDWLRSRTGAVSLLRTSALLSALGFAAALLAPGPELAIAAYLFAGLGLGNLAPVLFSGGGQVEPEAPGRGIAAVTTLGYAGFLIAPPLIGLTAEVTGLAVALSFTVFASLTVAVFAGAGAAADGK